MGVGERPTSMNERLVEEARGGSRRAFDALVTPHRRELHVHCYRMLGSYEDAEDAVQETFLRAWTRIATYAGTSTFRAWLYAIATNACLDALRRHKSRAWPTDLSPATVDGARVAPDVELPWLQPYPDALLGQDPVESAEDAVMRRETIELAFLAAIQHLPPRQRAVLILRDVLAWSAKEAASALGMTPAAVNSALQRAHAALAKRSSDSTERSRPSSVEEQAVVRKFIAAWEQADAEALAQLLADEARLVMPPLLTWFDGRDSVMFFFAGHAEGFPGSHLGSDWRLIPTRANGQPAFGLYRRGAGGVHEPFATGLLQVGAHGIEEISLFIGELANFDRFNLPASA